MPNNQNVHISLSHSFSIELAEQYGIECAILIHHFQYWVDHNQRLNRNFIKGRTWTYQTRKELAAHFPYWSEDQIRRYTDHLVEKGVLIKGNFNKKSMDKTIWYSFVNEEMFTIGKNANPPIGKNANRAGESAKAIPHTLTTLPKTMTNKGNDLEEGMPPSKGEEKNKKPSSRKFPLKKNQIPIFNWLKEQKIPTDDDNLIFYIRKYPNKLKDVVFFYQEQMKKRKLRNPAGFFRDCLEGKIPMITEESLKNKEIAEMFCELNDWKDIVITEKYLRDKITGDDLSFSMPEKEFNLSLQKLFDKSQNYK